MHQWLLMNTVLERNVLSAAAQTQGDPWMYQINTVTSVDLYSICWPLTSSLFCRCVRQIKMKMSCVDEIRMQYRKELLLVRFFFFLFPSSSFLSLRQQEVWVALSDRSCRQGLLYLETKSLGLRGRQDWRHWFGPLLHEVRQLDEDLYPPRHWSGWLTQKRIG